MNRDQFNKTIDDFKKKLEHQYLVELEKESFTLNDYGKFSLLNIMSSSETVESIKQLFISKFSDYKIGDKFQKIETKFYKTKEEISKSIVWKIYDISIFHNRENNNIYEFTYYCVDANDNYFPRRKSFKNLKSVDVNNGKFRTKYHYDKK